MSRQSWAVAMSIVLLIGLGALSSRASGSYTLFSPGPTLNVLGKSDGKPIITVSGHKVYRDDGQLRLVTIIPSTIDDRVGVIRSMMGWVNPDVSVFPYDTIYAKTDTTESVKEQSATEMTSSQDNAVAAALTALKVKYDERVAISEVTDGGPAAGKLRPGDRLLSVNGAPIEHLDSGIAQIQRLKPGTLAKFVVQRGKAKRTFNVRTEASEADPKKSVIKVGVGVSGFTFPFDVKLGVSDNIGGPSAGMMFALGVYDLLTPGSLTGGRAIAGTGEIRSNGTVGPIGGIQQKLVGAQNDGARLFLVPAENCAEALQGHYDPDKMRLTRVTSLSDAISAVKAWSANPNAELPRCTAS